MTQPKRRNLAGSVDQSRWQYGIRSLLTAVATIAFCLGISSWLLVDFIQLGLRIDVSAISIVGAITLIWNWLSYVWATRRAGPMLINLKREPDARSWAAIAVGVGFVLLVYLISKSILLDPAPAFIALVLLWMYTIDRLIDILTGHAIRFRANGVVASSGFLGWQFIPWRKCRELSWLSLESAKLSFGRWWFTGDIVVAPKLRESVEQLLSEKLGKE